MEGAAAGVFRLRELCVQDLDFIPKSRGRKSKAGK